MAFFALLWKARAIEKYRINYEREKINSIVMGNTHIDKTLGQKWRHYRYDTQKSISKTFKKWYPEGSGVSNFLLYLRTDQTFPNFLLKSVMGFVSGIILTYLCFMFFVFQLSISLINATIMSSTIGVLLTLGLAFSYRIRCLVFLLVPQLFSRVGRYTLTCYALVLILTGPATNTLKNSEVLTESMACSQEQIKISVHQLNDSIRKPLNTMRTSLKPMMERFQRIAEDMRQAVLKINRLVLSTVSVLNSSYNWLKSSAEMCNAKLGSPYNRCTKLLKNGVSTCRDALGPDYNWLCNVAYVAKAACVATKPYKHFCMVAHYIDDTVVATIKKKLRNFREHVREMFHAEVHIRQSQSFGGNGSRSAGQVAAGIVTEIRHRADPLLTWLSWSSCVTSLFLVLIIFRAKYYQHMYETRSRFDNRYITRELQELDLKRQRQGRETVLPLNRRERAKYITATSLRLVASEKVNMNRSIVFMTITTFKLCVHMVADYSLYWVLMTIRYHGRFQSNLIPGIPQTGVHITGNGFVARLFRSVVGTLDMPLSFPTPSPIPCLPNPYPPDLRRYEQIGVLIFLLWFFSLFEPYGLRFRHLIMGQYRPERAKARASWLYNHILRTRASFMKFARRKLHREFKYSSERYLTFQQWMSDHIPFQCLKCLFKLCPPKPHCLLCGLQATPQNPDTRLTRCETPKCPGIFCASCFSGIGQLCTICMSPADYGDLSDVSLERGSSDESSDSDAEPENVMRRPTDHDRLFVRSEISGRKYEKESSTLNENTSRSTKGFNTKHSSIKFEDTVAFLLDFNDKQPITNILYRNRLSKYINLIKETYITNSIKEAFANEMTIIENTAQVITVNDKRNKGYNDRITNTPHRRFNVRKSKKNNRVKNYIQVCKKIRSMLTIVRYFMANNGPHEIKTHGDNNEAFNAKKQKDMSPIKRGSKHKHTKNKSSFNKNYKSKKQNSKLEVKNSSAKLEEFPGFFSKHWRNIKFSLIPCVSAHKKREIKLSKERRNHKRRKKRQKCIDNKMSELNINNLKKDNKNTRNYRISAFLADLEWTKKDYNKRSKKKGDSAFLNTDYLTKSNNHKANTIIALAQVRSPRKQWSPTHASCRCSDKDCTCRKSGSSVNNSGLTKQKAFAKKALQRFRDKVKLLRSSSNVVNAKVDKTNLGTGGSFIEKESSEHLIRRMNYYHSMIKDDLVDCNKGIEKESIARDTRNTASFHGLLSFVNLKNNASKGNVCEFIGTNNRSIAVSRSKMPSRKNKSTYVYKKQMTASTQDRKETVDSAQDTTSNVDTLKSEIDLKQSKSKKTVNVLRELYSSIFGSTYKRESSEQHEELKGTGYQETAEKGIVAEPEICAVACQYDKYASQDAATQYRSVDRLKSSRSCVSKCDMGIGIQYKTCTCATQHISRNRNVGTMFCSHNICKRLQDAAVQYQRRVFRDENKVASTEVTNKQKHISNVSSDSYSSDSSESSTSSKTDETKTDTTVCSLATVDYNEQKNKSKKYKVKVVTKTNQSTLTDKTKCHDVSTFTNDWWSPILEKKERRETLPLKMYKEYAMTDKVKKSGWSRRRNRGVETDGKYVTFKSRTQIIPTGTVDVLSPSRYLLESQRYYNELFSYKFSPSQVYSVINGQRLQDKDKNRSPIGSRRSHHRKTKRLDECYSPRRQISPRKRYEDFKSNDSPRRRRQTGLLSWQKK